VNEEVVESKKGLMMMLLWYGCLRKPWGHKWASRRRLLQSRQESDIQRTKDENGRVPVTDAQARVFRMGDR